MVHTVHWCVVERDQGRDSLMERGKGEEREHIEGERRECDQAGPQKALELYKGGGFRVTLPARAEVSGTNLLPSPKS